MSAFEGTPRFEIVRRLGIGGMGAVFEALDRERDRHVALKVLTGENADALLRFKREFRALQSVHHPNLVSLGELFAQGDNWFFSMELVRGIDVLAYIRAEAPQGGDERTTLPGHRTLRLPHPVAEHRPGDDGGGEGDRKDQQREP